MSKLTDNIYDIEDIFIVKIKEDYKVVKTSDGYTQQFNPNFCHFTERFVLLTPDEKNIEMEIFSECFTGEGISYRENIKKDDSIPKMFEFIYPLPTKYLTKEEIESGKIRTRRLYQIFQLVNYEMFKQTAEKNKVKKLGSKYERNN